MINLERRRRNNNQFNRCSLNMQDKINCNNINELREERNANSIYTYSVISRAYVQSSSNPLEIFTNFVKISFITPEHPRDPFPLCSGNSQFKIQPVSWLQLTFWDDQKDFSLLKWMIQIEVPRKISLFKRW